MNHIPLNKKQFLLIDGHSLAYRAFYALPKLTTKKGIPTNAVYGFVNMLLKALNTIKPEYGGCIFDTPKPTYRHEKFTAYKQGRPKAPDDFKPQLEYIRKFCESLGINVIAEPGTEADDIIASIAKLAEDEGFEVFIITPDKDMFQLISNHIKIIRPKKGVSTFEIYDKKSFEKEFGFPPKLFPHYLALVGDKVDNIPGVKGIGPQKAKQLVKSYGTLEEIYANIKNIEPSLQQKLLSGKEDAFLSLQLINAIIEKNRWKEKLKELKIKPPDKISLSKLCNELEFKSIKKRLNLDDNSKQTTTKSIQQNLQNITVCKDAKEFLTHLNKEKETIIYLNWEGKYPYDCKIKQIIFLTDENTVYEYTPPAILSQDLDENIKKVLEDKTIPKATCSLKNTITVLKNYSVNIENVTFDIEIADYLLHPDKKEQTIKIIKEKNTKNDIPLKIKDLKQSLDDKLKQENLKGVMEKIDIPLCYVLSDMELTGIKIDKQKLLSLKSEVENTLFKIKQKIQELTNIDINLNSPKQVSWLLYEKLLIPKPNPKSSSTDHKTLLKLLEYDTPYKQIINLILKYREYSKILTAFINTFLNHINPITGKIYATFNHTTTGTGRLSSNNPNLQNLPSYGDFAKKFKECFIVSSEDRIFIGADYSQIELRVLAFMSKDEKLLEALEKGEDFHIKTASELFKIPPNKITPEIRRKAKEINFGIIYGISAVGLAERLGISTKEANKIIKAYFNTFPGVAKFLENQIKQAKERGYTVSYFGRKRYIKDLKNTNKSLISRIAINTPIQSTAADITKLAMIRLHKQLKDLGANIVLQIHDSLICEAPFQTKETAKKIIKDTMENILEGKINLTVNIKEGENLSFVW